MLSKQSLTRNLPTDRSLEKRILNRKKKGKNGQRSPGMQEAQHSYVVEEGDCPTLRSTGVAPP